MPTSNKRNVSESVKKVVASRQKWKCADCSKLLSSTYQVDHKIALADGGSNHFSNLSALCPNCHATKTQLECIARAERVYNERVKAAQQALQDAREDVAVPGTDLVRCTTCHATRPRTETSWADHKCPKLSSTPRESLAPTSLATNALPPKTKQLSLRQFLFKTPRKSPT